MANFENNLSKGNVAKQLFLFALPLLISNLIQTFYSVADMVIVGQMAGTVSMSGVNIGSQVTFLVTNMVFGLCVGATVLIGQYLGSNNKEALKQTISTLFISLSVFAVITTVLMLIFEVPILHLIQTPPESFLEAKRYFFVTTLGNVFIFGYNALSAVMRGMGDSKNPLIFVAIACVTNVILDIIFVGPLQMGAMGAAIATIISQALSMILCIIYLAKNDFIFDFKLNSFVFSKNQFNLLLKIGLPTSVQNVAVSTSFLFLTALTNSLGVVASASVGAVGKLNGFAILPAVAMSSSVSAMAAQNIGAGEIKRAKHTMYVGMIIAVVISYTIFVIFRFIPDKLLALFGDDPDMIQKGVDYLSSFSFDYLVVPFTFCLNGLFIGSGHTTFSFINSCMSSLLIRIPASYFFGMVLKYDLWGVGIAAPLASGTALIFAICYFFSGKWQKMTILK